MRAKTVNEYGSLGDYPWGAANDPNAPWNEKEDDSSFTLDIDGQELYITRAYNQTAEDEWDEEKGYVDMEKFDEYAAKQLGLNQEEQYEAENYLEINDWKEEGNKIHFDTTWGNFTISMDELVDMTNLF